MPIYKADLSAGSLLPPESRVVARLLLQGGTTADFDHAILIENVLQKPSPATARRQARLIKSRLETLPATIWHEIATGNFEVATQLMFAAALKHSALLHSFVRDVVADHARRLERTLSTHAWEPFLADCETRDPAVGTWTPSTRRKLLQVIVKDHLQTYKKRPIYWLFSSGKQGAFQALVYLHRYNAGTLARIRAEYVVPLTGKMQARLAALERDIESASSTALRNRASKQREQLHKKHIELLGFDEKLRHFADQRITLDLDDGVKVNYGKFGDLLDSVKVITGGKDEE